MHVCVYVTSWLNAIVFRQHEEETQNSFSIPIIIVVCPFPILFFSLSSRTWNFCLLFSNGTYMHSNGELVRNFEFIPVEKFTFF